MVRTWLIGLAGLISVAIVVSVTSVFSTSIVSPVSAGDHLDQAIFAGGCFWCMEMPYDTLDGVVSTTSGYTGGHTDNPTYRRVSTGRTGHAEAVRVIYDPAKISYKKLVDVFWLNIDPTDGDGQFCDRGEQYRSELYYSNDEQRQVAEASLARLRMDNPFQRSIVTQVTAATAFYPAEHSHQDYYQKRPLRYFYYRFACGRDNRLEELWGERAGGE